MKKALFGFLWVLVLTWSLPTVADDLPTEPLSQETIEVVMAVIQMDALYDGFRPGNPDHLGFGGISAVGGLAVFGQNRFGRPVRAVAGLISGFGGAVAGTDLTFRAQSHLQGRRIARSLPYRILATRTSPNRARVVSYWLRRHDSFGSVLVGALDLMEEQRAVVGLYNFIAREMRSHFNRESRPLDPDQYMEQFNREFLLFLLSSENLIYTEAEALEELIRGFYQSHSDFILRAQ